MLGEQERTGLFKDAHEKDLPRDTSRQRLAKATWYASEENTHTETFQRQHMAHHTCITGPYGAGVETIPNGIALAAGNQLAPLAHRRP